jgi:hypothetical protein
MTGMVRVNEGGLRFRFLHIPKTAGAVTNEAIVRHFAPSVVRWFSSPIDWIQCSEDLSGFQCLVGHAGFDCSHFKLGPVPFVTATILRDPVDRFLSNYFFHRNFGPPMGINDYITRGDDPIRNLDEMLNHPNFPMYGFLNFQTTMLTRLSLLPKGVLAPPYMVASLDDVERVDVSPAQQTALFDAAAEHLSQVDIVGCFEDLPKFYRDISGALGRELEVPPHRYNMSAKDEIFPPTHPEYRRLCQRIAELQPWDQMLYDAACSRYRH